MSNSQDSTAETVSPPRRFILGEADMEQFRNSPAKRELLSFVTALGRSTINCSYQYDPHHALVGLSPGMASLHGSLQCISSSWIQELPPDESRKARFGNPIFKTWHKRLVERSWNIIETIMDCHVKFVANKEKDRTSGDEIVWDLDILEQCSTAGYEAAASSDTNNNQNVHSEERNYDDQTKTVIQELKSYLEPSFGHHIRLDYGTGHESSFFIFLFSLCKLGIFGNIPKHSTPTDNIMAPVALSIVSQYLQICRGVQTDYMLEPAGSHGVWGLDDYHCIPFYIGSCQFQNEFVQSNTEYTPSSIHNNDYLNSPDGDKFLYFQCIRYIKSLKKGVPFFESSPMLDDISHLANWSKVSGGLLRLYEGEVLDKRPVVQHFVFGNIFKGELRYNVLY